MLRTFPGKNEKESSGKQMPSFPEMVHYIQEKVSASVLNDKADAYACSKGHVFHRYLHFLYLLQGSELVKVKLFIFIAISKTSGHVSNVL